MVNPVVHFEIIGTDPERLRRYYCALFGWNFAATVRDLRRQTGIGSPSIRIGRFA